MPSATHKLTLTPPQMANAKILNVARFCNLLPYRVHRHKNGYHLTFSKGLFTVNVMVLTLVTLGAAYIARETITFHVTVGLVQHLVAISDILSILITVWFRFLWSARIMEFLRSIYRKQHLIDVVLELPTTTLQQLTRENNRLIYTVLGLFSLIFGTYQASIVYQARYKTENLILYRAIYFGYVYYATMVIILEYTLLIRYVTNRYRIISDDLEPLLTRYEPQFLNELPQTPARSKNLWQLRFTQLTLAEICESINHAYGFTIAIFIVVTCMQATQTTFDLLHLLLIAEDDGSHLDTLDMVLWAVVHVSRVCFLVEQCHECARRRQLVVKRIMDVVVWPREMQTERAQFKEFAVQMLASARMESFTATGFFSIGRPLLTGILGTVVPYLIIMIQYGK